MNREERDRVRRELAEIEESLFPRDVEHSHRDAALIAAWTSLAVAAMASAFSDPEEAIELRGAVDAFTSKEVPEWGPRTDGILAWEGLHAPPDLRERAWAAMTVIGYVTEGTQEQRDAAAVALLALSVPHAPTLSAIMPLVGRLASDSRLSDVLSRAAHDVIGGVYSEPHYPERERLRATLREVLIEIDRRVELASPARLPSSTVLNAVESPLRVDGESITIRYEEGPDGFVAVNGVKVICFSNGGKDRTLHCEREEARALRSCAEDQEPATAGDSALARLNALLGPRGLRTGVKVVRAGECLRAVASRRGDARQVVVVVNDQDKESS
jgi:hypothetical protein